MPCRSFTYYGGFFLVVKHWISFWFSFHFAWKKILDGFTYSTYRSLNPLAMKFSKLTDLVRLLTFFQKEHLWIKPVNNKTIHFNVWTYMTCFCAYLSKYPSAWLCFLVSCLHQPVLALFASSWAMHSYLLLSKEKIKLENSHICGTPLKWNFMFSLAVTFS